jgi:hypothetical protein
VNTCVASASEDAEGNHDERPHDRLSDD